MKFQNKVVSLLLCATAWAVSGFSRARAQEITAAHAPEEVLVGMRQRVTLQASDVKNKVGVVYGQQVALNAYRVGVRNGWTIQDTIREIKKNPDVLYAEPNYVITTLVTPTPNDALYAHQYAPARTQADAAWAIWKPIAPITLAIVDTGVDSTHPDLINKILRDSKGAVIGYNAIDKTNNALDDHFHGTHCAGIAAAEANNQIGIAGIAGWDTGAGNYVQVMPVKVMDNTGGGYTSWVADGIVWAADHGAQVISLSLGSSSDSKTLASAVQYAWSKGVVLVAAAGNDGVNTKFYPAAYEHVISVGATDTSDTLTSFSNYGPWVKVAAPGLSIYSTMPNKSYEYLSGTSMATPHVAGEAALIRAQYPGLSNAEISALITTQTDPYQSSGGHTLADGAGRINVLKALQAAGGANIIALNSLVIGAETLAGGAKATATATLNNPAPSGGIVVALTSGDAKTAPVDAGLQIAAGKTTGTFTVTAGYPEKDTPVVFTARYGASSATANIRIKGVHPTALTPSASTVQGAATLFGTLTLDHATTNGKPVTVSLTSSSPSVTVPATVSVPAGAASVRFEAHSANAPAGMVTLSATANGVTVTATIMAQNNTKLDSVRVDPKQIYGGNPATLGITLAGKAPGGGAVITLTSGSSAFPVPATVTVPEGKTDFAIPVTSGAVSAAATITVTATYNGVSKTATVTVLPPTVSLLSLKPAEVSGGQTVTGTVMLNSPAPAGGQAVKLESSNAAVPVPKSVIVAAGAKSATFTFTAPGVTKTASAILRGSTNGSSQSATLTVKPSSGKK